MERRAEAGAGHDWQAFAEIAGELNKGAGNVIALFNLLRQCCTYQPGVITFSGLNDSDRFEELLEAVFPRAVRANLNMVTSENKSWYKIDTQENCLGKKITISSFFAATRHMDVFFKQMQQRYGLDDIELYHMGYSGFYPAVFKVMHLVFCYACESSNQSRDRYSYPVTSFQTIITNIHAHGLSSGCMPLSSCCTNISSGAVSMHERVLTFANAMHDWFAKLKQFKSTQMMFVDGLRFQGLMKARILLEKIDNYDRMIYQHSSGKVSQGAWAPPIEKNALGHMLKITDRKILALTPNGFRSAIRLAFRQYSSDARIDRLLKNILSICIYANVQNKALIDKYPFDDDDDYDYNSTEILNLYRSNWWCLLLSCATAELDSKSPLIEELFAIVYAEFSIISKTEWNNLNNNPNKLNLFKMQISASISEMCKGLSSDGCDDYPEGHAQEYRTQLTSFLRYGPSKLPELRLDDEINLTRINLQYDHLTSWLRSFLQVCTNIMAISCTGSQCLKFAFIITAMYCNQKPKSADLLADGLRQQDIEQSIAYRPGIKQLLDMCMEIESGKHYGELIYILPKDLKAKDLVKEFNGILEQLPRGECLSGSNAAEASSASYERENPERESAERAQAAARDQPLGANDITASLADNEHPPGGSPMAAASSGVQVVDSAQYKDLKSTLEADLDKTSLLPIVQRFSDVAVFLLNVNKFKKEYTGSASVVHLIAILQHLVSATHDVLRVMKNINDDRSRFNHRSSLLVDYASGFFVKEHLLDCDNQINSLTAKVSEDDNQSREKAKRKDAAAIMSRMNRGV